jgi:acyl-coenzyme A synthetase/AMP-(fatty) acid ligase
MSGESSKQNLSARLLIVDERAAFAAPREIKICSDLPKTKSVRIKHKRLRQKTRFDMSKVFIIK